MRNLKRGKIEEQEEWARKPDAGEDRWFFFVCVCEMGKKKIKSAPSYRPFRPQRCWKKTDRCVSLMISFITPSCREGGGARRRTMENKVNERSASKGLSNSSVVQHTHRDTRTHPHPHRYTQTLNRERRSSRWALSWLTVTHWGEQNSTRLFFFVVFPLTEHQPLLTYHNVKQPWYCELNLWEDQKVKKHPHNFSSCFFPHFVVYKLTLPD